MTTQQIIHNYKDNTERLHRLHDAGKLDDFSMDLFIEKLDDELFRNLWFAGVINDCNVLSVADRIAAYTFS